MLATRCALLAPSTLLALFAAALISITCFPSQGAAQVSILVTTTQQGSSSGQCSLQEAIYASELKSNKAIGATNPDLFYNTGCTPGEGGDTIILSPGAVYSFVGPFLGDSHNYLGPTATPIIFTKITIEGNGATLQLVNTFRPAISRLFAIGTISDPALGSGTGNLTLKNVYVKGFNIRGGNGGMGSGGGGLGAGGAIYVHEGALTVEDSTFENNGAVGGNGTSEGYGGSSGGGGGLFGNGGDGCVTGGGGGGGSSGNGGNAGPREVGCNAGGGGGGGGGTNLSGKDGAVGVTLPNGGGAGGFRCGATGGSGGNDGQNASCSGGGGGGGGGGEPSDDCTAYATCDGNGANGSYGGGGGGGVGDGGSGGFGGGGGSGWNGFFSVSGGNGGFGGGGGASGDGCHGEFCWSINPGKAGPFGGRADDSHGGGGGALGGAIFNHIGIVVVHDSTFFNNFVTRGDRGGGSAANGADAGGAIFSLGKALEIVDSTFSGNQATGSGAAIVVYKLDAPVTFVLNNNIIANNGALECFTTGSVTAQGSGNLISAKWFWDSAIFALSWSSDYKRSSVAVAPAEHFRQDAGHADPFK